MTIHDNQPTCPHCREGTSFDLRIRGKQEKARFVPGDSGVTIAQAGSAQMTEYDEDELTCRSCGRTTSEDGLILPE